MRLLQTAERRRYMEQRSLSGIKYIDPICRAVNTITHRPLIPEKHGALLSVPVPERPACGLSINVVLDQSLSMQKRNVYEDLRGLLTKLADGPKPLCNAEYSVILLQDSCLSLLSDYRPCSETRGWSENTPKAKGLTPLMAAVTLAAKPPVSPLSFSNNASGRRRSSIACSSSSSW